MNFATQTSDESNVQNQSRAKRCNALWMWIHTPQGWTYCATQEEYNDIVDSLPRSTKDTPTDFTEARVCSWMLCMVAIICTIPSILMFDESIPTRYPHLALALVTLYTFLCILLSNPCVLHHDMVFSESD